MILSFLNKPYPYIGKIKKDILTNFIIGCFIAFFLVVFQPFQINEWVTPHKTIKLIGFGFVSFIVPLIISFSVSKLIPQKTLEDKWKVWTEIFMIVIVLCFIAAGNMLYGRMLEGTPFTISNYFNTLLSVMLIGIFPVTLHVILKHNKLLKINYEKAILINSQLQAHLPGTDSLTPESKEQELKLVLLAENEKDKLVIHPAQLLYIESADNYSNVVYIENGTKKKQLIRSSLKRIESQLEIKDITRCHRGFIVNLNNIQKIEGNAAGYKLSFSISEDKIPVSRTYAPAILSKFSAT